VLFVRDIESYPRLGIRGLSVSDRTAVQHCGQHSPPISEHKFRKRELYYEFGARATVFGVVKRQVSPDDFGAAKWDTCFGSGLSSTQHWIGPGSLASPVMVIS